MSSNKFTGLLTIGLTIIFSSSACKKFLDIPPAPNQVESSVMFANDKAAVTAIAGFYANLQNSTTAPINGGLEMYTGLYADELFNPSPSSTLDPFFSNTLLSNNATVLGALWAGTYVTIYRTNAITEGLLKSENITDTLKTQLLGEMSVCRAICYFHLLNLFGDVPLATTTDYRVNAVMPRISVDEIYNYIITELQSAQTRLKTTYPAISKGRPNKWAATALLSRIYLYRQQWQKAETEATSVINSGQYTLTPSASIANNFLLNSGETIWQLVSDYSNTADAGNFVPSSTTTKPQFAITNHLLSKFETGDLRRTAWINKNTVSGVDYNYPFKYKVRAQTPITEHHILLRLAEMYLIRAEARTKLGDYANARADLNVIRIRAGLSQSTAATESSLLAAIAKERQTEFFCELGHRWFDLKRTGQADGVLSPIKAGWQSTDVLFPIPLGQIDVNVFLTQNPGY